MIFLRLTCNLVPHVKNSVTTYPNHNSKPNHVNRNYCNPNPYPNLNPNPNPNGVQV